MYCIEYFKAAGNTYCVADRRLLAVKFCRAGVDQNWVAVGGIATNGKDKTQSWCSDVTKAVEFTANACYVKDDPTKSVHG